MAPDRAGSRAAARRHGAWARVLGATTLALAAAAPALPHLPTTAVFEGLARGGSGGITFTETLDLAQDLGSRSRAPVLRYRTDDPAPVPLRVTATDRYADGRWHQAPVGDLGALEPDPPDGLELRTFTVTVLETAVRAPQVALPHALTQADLDVRWAWDAAREVAVVAEQPGRYRAQYWRTRAALPEGVGAFTAADPTDPALAVDPASQGVVTALAAELTAGTTNQVQAAMALQSYLRSSAFTYSLTLADPVAGPDGAPLDPISHFLQTRQGYCTQFASAMIMMARSVGIPARLAVGFLPGTELDDASWVVVAADAHAWPELNITGLGWTRFEPTPGVRAGQEPLYFAPTDVVAPVPGSTPQPGATSGAPVDEAANPTGAGTGPGGGVGEVLREHAAVLGLGLAGLALLLAAVPARGRWRRTAGRRRARSPAERVEAEWELLLAALADLGHHVPPAATPRQARDALTGRLPEATRAALSRATERLEGARYGAPPPAGPPPDVSGMAEDVAAVLDGARASAPRAVRLRAALWPASGRVWRDAGPRTPGWWQRAA